MSDAVVEELVGDLSSVRAPRGSILNARSWQTEAPLRMLLNNLDPEVAEHPESLVVYGGSGRAARSHEALRAIVTTLLRLGDDETLLVQSGKPVGVLRTHEWAPRVLIANSNLVGDWANWEEFRRLEALGLTMYGQLTAGSWIYIGSQCILQGTYETFGAVARKLAASGRYPDSGGTLAGTLTLTATCTDLAGNSARASSDVKVDATDPGLTPTFAPNLGGALVASGAAVTASPNATDEGSGVAESACGPVS